MLQLDKPYKIVPLNWQRSETQKGNTLHTAEVGNLGYYVIRESLVKEDRKHGKVVVECYFIDDMAGDVYYAKSFKAAKETAQEDLLSRLEKCLTPITDG